LLGWRRGGLSIRTRSILVILAAIPLTAINAGKSTLALPLLGVSDVGLIYPLLFIPVGILGATTAYNILAGFNGLEAGQGVILLLAMSIVAYLTGNPWLTIIGLIMVASLLAFLLFNYCPAKVFPGDVLTYSVGGMIAILSIFGNFERVAVFFFIPYIIETGLKYRGKFRVPSFGKLMKDGSLGLRYKKICSLNHLAVFILGKLGIRPTEKRAVLSIWLFQIAIIILGFIIFREGIFVGL
jgi:UDP-N-acetylglucosamine--dolichyl-phosphate N-acetylglucosaminephosphotransferase